MNSQGQSLMQLKTHLAMWVIGQGSQAIVTRMSPNPGILRYAWKLRIDGLGKSNTSV